MEKKRFETERPVVFAAMSKKNFFLREHIIRFILKKGGTPTCAFMMYSYPSTRKPHHLMVEDG